MTLALTLARSFRGFLSFLGAIVVPAVLAAPAAGPLRQHPTNPRYFTDGTAKPDGSATAVFLTGSHTWNNLVDLWDANGPRMAFDFEAYLRFLERHGHNFIRLWAWDSTTWDTRANAELGKKFVHHAAPHPWARTGPGLALDGKPKFDLAKFNAEYFERLRSRVKMAGDRGIYVSVLLFEGSGLFHSIRGHFAPWRTHPFHPANNINGIDPSKGSDGITGDVHNLTHANVNARQAAYIRKVVETVNDLDNVLYEVINEGGEKEWDWWVATTIRDAERTRPRQHLIGITGHGAERLDSMLASPADWISPGSRDGFGNDPPAWDGRKVSILDTDHIWGVGGNAAWVWKSFLRGHHPIFMDCYDGSVLAAPAQERRWESIRRAMGSARRVAERINLAMMEPHSELASTEYCLAVPGREYLVYQPRPGEHFTVELPAGTFECEWFNPQDGAFEKTPAVTVRAGKRLFRANFDGVAVLHLKLAANRRAE
ncbi:MAG: DUF6298 domain-containing protein [Opitutaceae bacterium]